MMVKESVLVVPPGRRALHVHGSTSLAEYAHLASGYGKSLHEDPADEGSWQVTNLAATMP